MTPQKPGVSTHRDDGTSHTLKRSRSIPLNQILYGPPGTGKTYATVKKALEIFINAGMDDVGEQRSKQRQRFDELVVDGYIRFVTFHQSFSYEDFVEGIRASTDEAGRIIYQVEDGIFKELCREAHKAAEVGKRIPYVLIIDEINRGNISRIFGELITLVEESHRSCLPGSPHKRDSISVRLPYSRESFSVPENVYIIGTMNTADRSLTSLDVALRRRFSFTEMPPCPDLLKNKRLRGTDYSLDELLDRMNRRIAVLLDREHCLGHAWFMGLDDVVAVEDLAKVFRNHVLPLLEEYFFEDWEKIRWVLNDHRKESENCFLLRDENDLSALFGEDVPLPDRGQAWRWNQAAFENMDAYVQIIDATLWAEDEVEGGDEDSETDIVEVENTSGLGEPIDAANWNGYTIEKYKGKKTSTPIRIKYNSEYINSGDVTKKLDEIALQLGILFKKTMNTQEKGKRLIQKLKELGQKA